MVCPECKIESDGTFCKNCGRRLLANKYEKSNNTIISVVIGVVMFLLSFIGFIYANITVFSDLDGKYTYNGTLTSHEISYIFLIVLTLIIMIFSMIILWKERKIIKFIGIFIIFLFSAVVLWSGVSFVANIHTCDRCGTLFFGTPETDLFDKKMFCYDCGNYYWSY